MVLRLVPWAKRTSLKMDLDFKNNEEIAHPRKWVVSRRTWVFLAI